MDNNVLAQRKKTLETVGERLRGNGFTVYVTDAAGDAAAKVLELVAASDIVGCGGSQTVLALGILEKLAGRGQQLLCPKPGMPRDEVMALRRRALTADVFLGSPNAVTRDGKLFFVDKIGNRAAGMTCGPKKIIAIAGYNKIVTDETAAWDRVDNYAAPVNARRLGLSTPCVQTGACSDCSAKERICNIAVTLMKKPSYSDYHVILVPEELGY